MKSNIGRAGYAALILIVFFITIQTANANSITFNDLGLTHSRFDIYTIDPFNSTTSMIMELNSTDTWYFDPDMNYQVIVRPGMESTALSSPSGLVQILTDNGGAIIILLALVALVGGFFYALSKGVFR